MKNLIKIISYLLAAELTFGSPLSAKAQTVSGYITDLFNNQPIPQAIVTVDGLGSGITNDQGYYAIGDTTNVVEFPYVITPRKTSKIDIFNIIGQKVISLDNIIEGSNIDLNNFSKGIYILRYFDNRGEIIGHNRISNINGENSVVLSVPDRIVDVNPKDNGRKINSPMDNYEVRVNHPDYWERVTYINEPIGNVEFNEGLIDGNDSLRAHRNESCGINEFNGTDKWDVDTLNYAIFPNFIQGGSLGEELISYIDSALTHFIEPIVRLYTENTEHPLIVNHYFTDEVPSALQDTVLVYGDLTAPFPANLGPEISQSINKIISMGVCFSSTSLPFSTILGELTQALGPIYNSNHIVNSVFSDYGSDFYTSSDSLLLESFLDRKEDWRDLDTHISN